MIGLGFIGSGVVYLAFGFFEDMWGATSFVVFILCAEQFFASLATVGKFALFMSVSWVRVAGTQFTAYMAMLNASKAIGNATAGTVDAALTYPQIYLLCGALMVIPLLILPFIDPTQTRRVLGAADTGQDAA
jgi:hypothetical protein